jgi:Mn2+/Fe2+ NRAMP family transporter
MRGSLMPGSTILEYAALRPLAGVRRRIAGFSAVIVGSLAVALALVGIGLNPIKALCLAAIFNGVTAPPLILLIIVLTRSKQPTANE